MCRDHPDIRLVSTDLPSASAQPRLSRRDMMRYGLLLGAAAVGGCAPENAKPTVTQGQSLETQPRASDNQPTAQITNTDECAGRLHDICGALLLYHRGHRQLPNRLDDLLLVRGFGDLELTCPVSRRPYVYNPIGIITPDNQPRMICYDPAPSHSGMGLAKRLSSMRWAISIIEPRDNGTLIAKVVAVPESGFTLKIPR